MAIRCVHSLKLETTPRNLGTEADGAISEEDIVAKLDQRIIEVAKSAITTRSETNRAVGKEDKSCVQVPEYKYK